MGLEVVVLPGRRGVEVFNNNRGRMTLDDNLGLLINTTRINNSNNNMEAHVV